jgi:PAS domain S-box-containing protein
MTSDSPSPVPVRQSISDALIILDEQDRVIEATRLACELTGYSREDLISRSLWDLSTSSEAEEASRLLGKLQEEAIIAFDAGLRVKDGTTQSFRLRLSRLSVAGRRHSVVRVARRRRAADKLADDPDITRALLEAAGTLLLVLDSQGRIAYVNPICEARTGFSAREIRGKRLWELASEPEEQERVKAAIDDLPRGRFPSRFDMSWKSKRGGSLRLSWSATLLLRADGSVRYVLGTGLETGRSAEPRAPEPAPILEADRSLVEKALRESEERFQRFAENAEDLLYRFRLSPQPGYEYVSSAVQRMTGYSADEFYRDPRLSLQVIHPNDRRYVEEVIKTGKLPEQPLLLRWIRRDGRELWVEHRSVSVKDASGRVVAIEGIARDVTERRRTERCQEALHSVTRILAEAATFEDASPGILREVAECLGWEVGTIWLVDRADDVLRMSILWHGAAVQIPEFDAASRRSPLERGADLAGRVWEAARPLWIHDLASHPEFLLSPVAAREGLHGCFAFPILLADEVLGVLEFLSREVRQPDAQMIAMIGSIGSQIGQFIERKSVEAEVRRLNEGLERRVEERTAQLEAAIREMASFTHTIAHDLRAPLRAMSGFAQAILDDYGPTLDPTCLDYARRVATSAQKMDALIVDLLAYGRLIHLDVRLEPVSLETVVRLVLGRMGPELTARGAEVEVVRPLVSVRGNVIILDQILTNLLSNAVKFVAPGVRPRVTIRSERRDQRVCFSVQDNGIGIDPQFHDRIFGIFQRLNREEDYPGTGIGLAIVRKALERMGGRSGVESARGSGSRFWIELPAAEREEPG